MTATETVLDHSDQLATPEAESLLAVEALTDNEHLLEAAILTGFEPLTDEEAQAGVDFSDLSTREKLGRLKDFANANWNFRGGKERWEADHVPLDDIEGPIMQLADSMNMRSNTVPENSEPDILAVPGAKAIPVITRVQYAHELMTQHDVQPRAIVLLGSQRAIDVKNGEDAKADFYAPEAESEFDLMVSAAHHVFGEGAKTSDNTRQLEEVFHARSPGLKATGGGEFESGSEVREERDEWKVAVFETDESVPVIVLGAPIKHGNTRATARDTDEMLRTMLDEGIREDDTAPSALVVTTALHAPQQDLNFRRMVGNPSGAKVETVGFAYDHYDGKFPPVAGDEAGEPQGRLTLRPQDVLQEMNATINKASYILADSQV